MSKITDTVFRINHNLYLKQLKKRIKNKDFTIISNNCTAGFIYHDLGLQFRTPTINFYFKTDQFIKFVKDLKFYLDCPLIQVKKKGISYPVGVLKSNCKGKEDIYLYFNHYDSFEDAKEKWQSRIQRINYDNICYIMDFYDSAYDAKLIDEFNQLDLDNKVILIHNKNIKKDNTFCFRYEEDKIPNGKLFMFHGLSGKRFLDEFDYVSFLNHMKRK